MIDVKTGHFLIDKDRSITPQMSLETLDKWQLGISKKMRQMDNSLNWVEVKNLKIDALYLNISFLFKDKKIDGFTFTFQNQAYDLNPSWDSWSKELEEANLVRFNRWLEDQFGEARVFEWGTVEAFYDSKSGGSSIKLTYV
ncbi:MAG: Unknown protein [uncultured Aureispira sp.]|uniref:Uncharacterized protein n=1 Tax=uncultured Aureispira sp. TaxID=1331704 RepID=A0A6S6UHJ8_9BACT|nr:MAG: Unknown protein [uncultured Aureispira sp.]